MPNSKNAWSGNTSLDDADDDVVDLLEVVKPGKPVAASPDSDEDFSKDLDSMLDTLSRARQAKENGEADDSPPPAVVPFPDPTPVDHEVDYNERLDLPGMEDLDKILHSLGPGAQTAATKPESDKADEPVFEPTADAPDIPDPDALPATAQIPADTALRKAPGKPDTLDEDFLDELLAEADGGDVPHPETLSSLPVHEPDLDLLTELGLADSPEPAAAAAAKEDVSTISPYAKRSSPAPVAASLDADGLPFSLDAVPDSGADDDAKAPQGGKPGSATRSAVVDSARPNQREEVDLNELDALLDDMLATAPASGPTAPVVQAAADLPEKKVTPGGGFPHELAQLRQEISELRGDLEQCLADVRKEKADVGPDEQSVTRQLKIQGAKLEAQAARLEDLELSQTDKVREYNARLAGQDAALSSLASGLAELKSSLETRKGAGASDELAEGLASQAARLDELASARESHAAKLNELDRCLADQAAVLADLDATLQASGLAELKALWETQKGAVTTVDALAEGMTAHAARLDELASAGESRAARLAELGGSLADQAARLEDLDTTLAAQAGKALEDTIRITEQAERAQDLAGQLAALQETFVGVNERMRSLEQRFAHLQENLEKLAAEAAAKVIREELAALMDTAG